MAGIKLYRHQFDALQRMKNGCILCGGVGSGKSRTALAYYYKENGGEIGTEDHESGIYGTEDHIPMNDPPQDLYIITTARKRDTLEWEGEMAPFLLSTHPEVSLYRHKVTVDSWNNIQKYVDVTGAFFIFDEQRVVGNGVWVKSFIKIAKANPWVLLSATPGDTWSDYIPVFIANGFYRNRTEFTEEHIVYKAFGNFRQVDRYLGTRKLERLRNSILVDMEFVRPAISHHKDVWTQYDVQGYKDIWRDRWNAQEGRPILNAAECCYQLRRLVNSHESRLQAVLDIFAEHPKVIVFYNFDYELELLRKLPWGKQVKVAEWNGHVHQPIPKGRTWAYLVQYNAGAEGWNCVETDTIIFFSQNYSYKVMVQSSGRIDRMNTPFKDLYYFHLKSRSGIDLAIGKALREKKKFNERAFTGQ